MGNIAVVESIDIQTLAEVIRRSWTKETCYPPDRSRWTKSKPAVGQCAVTSLVVHDYFGGELLFCKNYNHFWNRLPDGQEVDLTKSQFPESAVIKVDGIVSRDVVLSGERAEEALTPQRYLTLKKKVQSFTNGRRHSF